MKRSICLILTLVLTAALLCPAASAKEIILEIEYVKITESGFEADSLYGVPALYNRWDPIMCVELVERYYRELYGLELMTSPGLPKVVGREDCWFEETTQPKTGDVAFAPGWKRGTWYNHYAICKYANKEEDYILLIEQNWSWNGQAGIERKIPYSDSCYTFYTLTGRDGAPQPAIPEEHRPSGWAEPYLKKGAAYHTTDCIVDSYHLPVDRRTTAGMLYRTALVLGKSAQEGQTAVQAVQSWGLMECDETGSFCPDGSVSWNDAAVILDRFLRFVGKAPDVEDALEQNVDIHASSELPCALQTLHAAGLDCLPQGELLGQKALTTEQMLALVVRIADNPCPVNLMTAGAVRTQSAAAASAADVIADKTPVTELIGNTYR